jgi:protein-tyrosine phosphatase
MQRTSLATNTERKIPFQSIVNFRDLGGLPAEGGLLRRGVLFRSGTLHLASPRDAELLDAIGLRTVVDLRTDDERARWPAHGAWTPARIVHAPLLRSLWSPEDLMVHSDAEAFLAARYMDMIQHSGDVIAHAMTTVAECGLQPAVIHCAAGKDRTGVLTAMILGALGVDDDTIADDYHESASAMGELQQLFSAADPVDAAPMLSQPAAFLSAPRNAMAIVLSTITNEFGGIPSYVASIGVSPGALHSLRENLVVR